MKLGIIVDSSCGLSKKQAEKKGWGFLPLYLYIDGKEYESGKNLSTNQYYKKINLENETKTSVSSIGEINFLLDKFSKKYDHVIVYCISKNISSQTKNLLKISKEYKNVFVVESKSVGQAIVKDCEEILKFSKNVKNFEKLKKYINKIKEKHYGFVVPKNLDWLVKGGRASKRIAKMAKLTKIVPIIEFKNGKLEKGGKGRIFNKTIIKITKKIHNKNPNAHLMIYHANNHEINEIKEKIEKIWGKKIESYLLSPIITNHIGLGAIALYIRKK